MARINNWKAIGHDLPADPIDCCFSCRKETPEKLINFSCLLWIGSAAVFAHGTSFHSDKNDEEQFVTAGEFRISSHLTNYAHSVRVLSTTVHWTVSLYCTLHCAQRYTYRVLQTIQMKLILLCVWAEPAIFGSVKTALRFKYEIQIG